MPITYKYYVYILVNYSKTVFYVGFTNDIIRRIIEHKNNFGSGFTSKYKLKYLVYFEDSDNVYRAMEREKEIKKWRREKKVRLISSINPGLHDLSGKLFSDNGLDKIHVEVIAQKLRASYKFRQD